MNIKRRNTARISLYLLLFVSIIIFSLLAFHKFYSVHNAKPVSADLSSSSGKRSFGSFDGLSFIQHIDDKTSLKIRAKKAHIRNRKIGFLRVAIQKVAEMEDVAISFFENGREINTVTSSLATLDMGTNNVRFEGKVKCVTEGAGLLETEKLVWDNEQKILNTDERYIYTDRNGHKRTGQGFEFREINFAMK